MAKATPVPRLVSREVQKAETKLINFARRRQTLVDRHQQELVDLDGERRDFIAELPVDVAKMLVAGGVITEEKDEEAAE